MDPPLLLIVACNRKKRSRNEMILSHICEILVTTMSFLVQYEITVSLLIPSINADIYKTLYRDTAPAMFHCKV